MARVVGVSRNGWARGAFAALHGAPRSGPERARRAGVHRDTPRATPTATATVTRRHDGALRRVFEGKPGTAGTGRGRRVHPGWGTFADERAARRGPARSRPCRNQSLRTVGRRFPNGLTSERRWAKYVGRKRGQVLIRRTNEPIVVAQGSGYDFSRPGARVRASNELPETLVDAHSRYRPNVGTDGNPRHASSNGSCHEQASHTQTPPPKNAQCAIQGRSKDSPKTLQGRFKDLTRCEEFVRPRG